MNDFLVKHTIEVNANQVVRDGQLIFTFEDIVPTDIPAHLYRTLAINYPKFFKMDKISKLGFIAVELLMQVVDSGIDKDKVALLLTTTDGCKEIDEKFEYSRSDIPSPALFVYTLPNIVAGEICIRNGFKGEQMVLINDNQNKALDNIYLKTLFSKGNTDACIVGYINAYKNDLSCNLSWIAFK